MASRPGLEIRAAAAADAEGLSDLLAEIGHAVAADRLAERIEALRRGSGPCSSLWSGVRPAVLPQLVGGPNCWRSAPSRSSTLWS